MYLTLSFAGFALPRERGEYFGWALPRCAGRKNGFDRIGANHDAPTVKPVLDIAAARRPFEIVRTIIERVFIDMMNDIKLERIRDKGVGHHSMDKQTLLAISGDYADSSVSVAGEATSKNLGSIISSDGAANEAANSLDAPKVTDLIAGGRSYVSPLFSGEAVHIDGRSNDAEMLLNSGLDVKLLGFVGDWIHKPSHQEPVVRLNGKKFAGDVSLETRTMVCRARQPSYSELVGKLVSSIVAWNRSPSFSILAKFFRRFFGEKRSHHIGDGEVFINAANAESNSPVVDLSKHSASLTRTARSDLGPLYASNSSQAGPFVESVEARNGNPLFTFVHRLPHKYQSNYKNQEGYKAQANYLSSDEFSNEYKEI